MNNLFYKVIFGILATITLISVTVLIAMNIPHKKHLAEDMAFQYYTDMPNNDQFMVVTFRKKDGTTIEFTAHTTYKTDFKDDEVYTFYYIKKAFLRHHL